MPAIARTEKIVATELAAIPFHEKTVAHPPEAVPFGRGAVANFLERLLHDFRRMRTLAEPIRSIRRKLDRRFRATRNGRGCRDSIRGWCERVTGDRIVVA
jgi:hypothetical protein